MKRFYSIFAALLLMLVTPTAASAADADGSYAVKGIGRITCADLGTLIENQSVQVQQALGWVMGYITAQNALQENLFDLLPWQSDQLIFQQVVRNCRNNPQVILNEVVKSAIPVFRQTAIETRERYLSIKVNEQEAFLYESTLLAIKRRLNEKTGSALKETAEVDQATVEALLVFQQQQNIPATGTFDQQTLVNLLIGK